MSTTSRQAKHFRRSRSDYFSLTPAQFFDEGTQNPELIQKAVSGMKQLSEADLLMLLGLINRLLDTKNKSEGM